MRLTVKRKKIRFYSCCKLSISSEDARMSPRLGIGYQNVCDVVSDQKVCDVESDQKVCNVVSDQKVCDVVSDQKACDLACLLACRCSKRHIRLLQFCSISWCGCRYWNDHWSWCGTTTGAGVATGTFTGAGVATGTFTGAGVATRSCHGAIGLKGPGPICSPPGNGGCVEMTLEEDGIATGPTTGAGVASGPTTGAGVARPLELVSLLAPPLELVSLLARPRELVSLLVRLLELVSQKVHNPFCR